MNFPTLKTERLLLRQLSLVDAEEIFRLRCDPEHNRYINRPLAASIEDANSYIRSIIQKVQSEQIYFWAISLKPLQTLVGTVMFLNYDPEKLTAELGYELSSAHQGKGIMQEAVAAVLNFGKTQLKLKHIEATVEIGNERSFSVLRKFGFRKDVEKCDEEVESWSLEL
jgi:ribosomal-protein-alanine N-acetyltransferase